MLDGRLQQGQGFLQAAIGLVHGFFVGRSILAGQRFPGLQVGQPGPAHFLHGGDVVGAEMQLSQELPQVALPLGTALLQGRFHQRGRLEIVGAQLLPSRVGPRIGIPVLAHHGGDRKEESHGHPVSGESGLFQDAVGFEHVGNSPFPAHLPYLIPVDRLGGDPGGPGGLSHVGGSRLQLGDQELPAEVADDVIALHGLEDAMERLGGQLGEDADVVVGQCGQNRHLHGTVLGKGQHFGALGSQ